jgi:hypothetical protein
MIPIPASEAEPGFYRTQRGDVIKIVQEASSLWRQTASADRIPYKRRGNPDSPDPCRQVTVYGWLPLDYPVKPAKCPGWWRRLDQAKKRPGEKAPVEAPTFSFGGPDG